MGGRGSASRSSVAGGSTAWRKQTVHEQAVAIATSKYDESHKGGAASVEDSIPDWVYEKKLSSGEMSAWKTGDGAVIKRETEKAYLIANNTDYGQLSFWMPKTWMSSPEKARSDSIANEAKRIVGAEYNHWVKAAALAAHVPIGTTSSTAGILAKLEKAGFKNVMSKDAFSELKGKVQVKDRKFY